MENQELLRLKQENERLKLLVHEYEQVIIDISAPIIPSILPETILVPITGKLVPERFENIIAKLLKYASTESITTVVIDFSAISLNEIGDIDTFGHYIDNMTKALNLVGVKVLYCGFSSAITQNLISSGLTTSHELRTFMTFKKALQYLMKTKGMAFAAGYEETAKV